MTIKDNPSSANKGITNNFPDNFHFLHEGEELIRARSIEAVRASSELTLHMKLCENGANLIHYFIHRDDRENEDNLTIRLLGIRVFNCLNTTIKLLLSGYYQSSVLQLRDMIETSFLLDHLQTNRHLIARWRTGDAKILRDEFAPVQVRKALDARDSYTGEKRGAAYKLFCTLAGHPHPQGFSMLRLPDGTHHCGPFFEERTADSVIAELGKSVIQAAAIFSQFFKPHTKQDYQIKLDFLTCQQHWIERFFNTQPVCQETLDELQDLMNKLPT